MRLRALLVAGFLAIAAPGAAVAQPSGAPYPTTLNQTECVATGSTGAVVCTLTAVQGKTGFICGWNVQATGGTATVSPIVIAGLQGGSQTYNNVVSAAAPGTIFWPPPYTPCLPASAQATNITITTTANGTATSVAVQAWGFNY
jgi:hypothetical protein